MEGELIFYCCCNKLQEAEWVKTTQIYYLTVLGVRMFKMDPTGLKSRCWEECVPSGGSRRVFLPLPLSWDHPDPLAHGPFKASVFKSLPDSGTDPSASVFHLQGPLR